MRYFQRTYQITPTYKMISQEGQHQEKVFRVSVLDKDGNILEIGEGTSEIQRLIIARGLRKRGLDDL